MVSRHYPWKRFWCPRGGTYGLDNGFLADPEILPSYYTGVVPFKEIAGYPCLALLGEPGIGKSQAMTAEKDGVEAALRASEEPLLWIDLRSFGDENRLLRKSFESDLFNEWVRGSHRLHLFLDSLDECRLRVPHVAALLMEQLREVREHIGRLQLRIACRTAEWPSQLEEGLPELWGKEHFGAFELAPLRRKDVRMAAEIEGLQPSDAFLTEIDNKDAQPLAMKPVTLRFLINVHQRDGRFPARQADLYHEGCQILVGEPSQSRIDAKQTGHLDPAQRLSVAARIAAVLMFCRRSAVYLGVDPGEASADDVRLDELAGGTESARGETFFVGETEVREALETGLFSSRGPNRLGFAHQTYAEFLAAHYLLDRMLEPRQMLGLVCHAEDPRGAVVPQLAETAAWLAGMNEEVFREILKVDPQILLRSDVAQADPADRAALVGGLLELFAAKELMDDRDLRDGYRRLSHPGLAQQLTPYLKLGPEAWLVRRVAIDMAESCGLIELKDQLLGIALDSKEYHPTRTQGARAIAKIGDAEAKRQLLPLASGVAEDANDELKGVALRALWPGLIAAREAFGALTPIKDEHLLGSYRDFLDRHLLAGLQEKDLPEALRWVQEQPKDPQPLTLARIGHLAEEILERAFRFSQGSAIRSQLVTAILARSEKHDRIQEPDVVRRIESGLDEHLRRNIVKEMMAREVSFDQKRWGLTFHGPLLVRPQDLNWILASFREAVSDQAKKEWAQLARIIFSGEQTEQVDVILEEAQTSPALADAFKGLLLAVELEPGEAAKLRLYAQRELQYKERPQPRLLEPPPSARIAKLLGDFEQGDLDAWWQLVRDMTLEPTSTRYGELEFKPDLTELPGWNNAGKEIRNRILRAAQIYLVKAQTQTSRWFGKSVLFRPDFAGFKALCLLAKESPGILDDLAPEVWGRWVPIILGYPIFTGSEAPLHQEIVAQAYRRCADDFLDFLNQIVNLENRTREHLSVLDRLESCWDQRLIAFFGQKVRRAHLRPNILKELLGKLIQLRSVDAERFARSLVQVPVPKEVKKRARGRAAVLALLGFANDAGWKTVQPALEADPEWGREVFEEFVGAERQGVAQRLSEDEVANLYIWLAREYPAREDPELNGFIGPRGEVGLFRDGLLSHLRDRGTLAACHALERVVESFPDLEHLKFYLLTARQNMLRQTWIPPSPSDFLQLSRGPGSRWIRNAEQLFQVILESLQRLNQKLQGKPPMARYLWDGSRPMDEESLSDWIKVHLGEDLRDSPIVALREVQVERGEETDVHVTALVPGLEPGTWQQVNVIIEVKGSWHKEVKTAMRDQLVERYLKHSECRHGIYVVGWYRCDAWAPNDSRAGVHKTWTWEKADKELSAQAQDLSREGLTIRAVLLDVRLRGQGAASTESSKPLAAKK